MVTANETYFVSPNYPNTRPDRLDPPVCIFTLQRNQLIQKWPVCQIRLDFDEFSLASPLNGSCGKSTDSFLISGASNFNVSGLPASGLCGELSGQHLYVDVDPTNPSEPLLLVINTGNEQAYNRKWSIRVQQIPCHSPFRAPPGCLQYFTGESNIVESLNFRGMSRARPLPLPLNFDIQPYQFQPNQQFSTPNYFNNLNYGICVAKQAKMCGIRWEAVEFDIGGSIPGRSHVGTYSGTNNYGCVLPNQGVVGGVGDTGDYISILGSSRDGRNGLENRFCGQKLAPEPQLDTNVPIVCK